MVLVVLAFVLPIRVAAITAFGIPFSFLGALGYFYFTDVSINLISMIGLIIVVGMLVDDAVVVTENTQRLREQGLSPKEAAIKGTQQVWAPVTVSVLIVLKDKLPAASVFKNCPALPSVFGKVNLDLRILNLNGPIVSDVSLSNELELELL